MKTLNHSSRTIAILVFVVLLTTSAHGSFILSASRILPKIRSDSAEPWTSTFELNQGIREDQFTIAEFTLPTDTTFKTFLITEENVDEFGETWENVETWTDGLAGSHHSNHRVVSWTHNGLDDETDGQSVAHLLLGSRPGEISSFNPTEIKVEVAYAPQYLFDPAVSQLRWTITGEATLIPEPTSILLCMIGAAGFVSTLRRYR